MAINLSNLVGNGPAFLATGNGTQNISQSTQTRVSLATTTFDSNNNYNNSLYEYSPTVAGYYQVNAVIRFSVPTSDLVNAQGTIYKNGGQYAGNVTVGLFNAITPVVSTIIYLNGTGDAISVYAYMDTSSAGSTKSILLGACFFSASLVYRT